MQISKIYIIRNKAKDVPIFPFCNLKYDQTNNILILGKKEVNDGDPAKWTKKTNLPEGLTKSWQNHMVKEVVQDFQASVLQVNWIDCPNLVLISTLIYYP